MSTAVTRWPWVANATAVVSPTGPSPTRARFATARRSPGSAIKIAGRHRGCNVYRPGEEESVEFGRSFRYASSKIGSMARQLYFAWKAALRRPFQDLRIWDRAQIRARRRRIDQVQKFCLIRSMTRDDQPRPGLFARDDEVLQASIFRNHPAIENNELTRRIALCREGPVLGHIHDFHEKFRPRVPELHPSSQIGYDHDVGTGDHRSFPPPEEFAKARWQVGGDHLGVEVKDVID